MTAQGNDQVKAAAAAARARQVIAQQVAKLALGVESDDQAQVILHLAEAYSHLAAEPPRIRAG